MYGLIIQKKNMCLLVYCYYITTIDIGYCTQIVFWIDKVANNIYHIIRYVNNYVQYLYISNQSPFLSPLSLVATRRTSYMKM